MSAGMIELKDMELPEENEVLSILSAQGESGVFFYGLFKSKCAIKMESLDRIYEMDTVVDSYRIIEALFFLIV